VTNASPPRPIGGQYVTRDIIDGMDAPPEVVPVSVMWPHGRGDLGQKVVGDTDALVAHEAKGAADAGMQPTSMNDKPQYQCCRTSWLSDRVCRIEIGSEALFRIDHTPPNENHLFPVTPSAHALAYKAVEIPTEPQEHQLPKGDGRPPRPRSAYALANERRRNATSGEIRGSSTLQRMSVRNNALRPLWSK
jgi:hypothetical protein